MSWLKLLISKLRNLVRLDPKERSWLLQALVLLPLIKVSLKTKGVKYTQKILQRLSSKVNETANSQQQLEMVKITRSVLLAAENSPIASNCLQRSLTLWFLLRCQGIKSDLRIGVSRDSGKFEAHAWIECDGKVLNDSQTVRQKYVIFDRPIEVQPGKN